jgi:murein L,D-transpeptidase YafK
MDVMKWRKLPYLMKGNPSSLLLVVVFSLIIQLTHPAFAKRGSPPNVKPGLVPAAIIKWPDKGSDYAILVDKSQQKVMVYHRDNLLKPLKVYSASTGENGGPKYRTNDRKTPEGIYFFTRAFAQRELAPIYGARAFAIDYPSPIDKKRGKRGYGIWFHGTNKSLKPRDTRGCVALDNPNINDLANYIRLHDTPVIISEKIEMIRREALEKEKRGLIKVIEGWRKAWEDEEIDRYMSFYSPKFTSGGKGWRQIRTYKANLAKRYKDIKVEIQNLRLFKNDGVVMAKFNQKYETDVFRSMGEKRLYLKQNSLEWKITGEFFRLAKKERVFPKKTIPTPSEDIRGFISSWKMAWEGKDLNTYISYYDAQFRSRGMDLRAWRKHREKLNRKYRSVKIGISDLKIVSVSNRKAKVRFKQRYQADQYTDFGLKDLIVIKRGPNWKIKAEQWRPLNGKRNP